MADFQTYEKLFEAWARWRSGPLKVCSPVAREILFTLLGEMAESPKRGHLLDSVGRAVPIGEVRTLTDCYQLFADWSDTEGDFAKWPEAVAELSTLGFLAQTPEGIWFCPQMVRGEI